MKIGEFLVNDGFVDQEAVTTALSVQRYRNRRLGRLLVELELIGKDDLDKALHSFFDCACKLSVTEIEDKMRDLMKDQAFKSLQVSFGILPIAVSESQVEFVSRRFSDEVVQAVESRLGKDCRLYTLPADSMDYLLEVASAEKGSGRSRKLSLTRLLTGDEKLASREPFTRIFRDCLQAATKAKASDIHFEPEEKRLTIRLRVHGDLHEWTSLPVIHKEAFTAKIKSLLNLDLAISGAPQDSRATFNEFGIDIRVNSTPIIYGEKIVARLLDQNRSFDIKNCGLSESATSALVAASHKREGLILISGPTGSGKTTTLYSLISSLDRKRKNICTLENPVEYRLAGINQVDVGTRSLSFSSALRALMRQDPDIILVGEIRDQETAELCFKAASTGHLVLSTVHANGACEVIERLINLGIDRFSIKSNLRLSAAQRLVRELCPVCALEAPSEARIRLVGNGLPVAESLKVINRSGCKLCSNDISSGIKGRRPVLEYMTGEHVESYLGSQKNRDQLVVDSIAGTVAALTREGIVDAQEAFEFL